MTEEAATASLSTWTVCYFYNFDTRPWITKTVKRAAKEVSLLDLEKETFRLINVERQNLGLSLVTWSDNLHDGSRNWSNTMQEEGKLYHDSIGVQTYYFAECCYGASWSGYRSPAQTVESWMDSGGHRAILMGSYSIGAIGIANDNGFFATYRCK